MINNRNTLDHIEANKADRIKVFLYKISPHLHPRIVKKLSFDADNNLLKIDINDKAPIPLLAKITSDFAEFNSSLLQNNVIVLCIDEKDYELYLQKKSSHIRQESHIAIARSIKDTTDVFDYEIIEKKPSGFQDGIKFGNAFLKDMNVADANHHDYFLYVALHRFLGTKSPQVNLIKDSKQRVWMVSRGLSQTYEKKNRVKTKMYENMITSNIDQVRTKSIAKLMVLAVLLRIGDLNDDNIGTVKDNKNTKVAIVDPLYNQENFPDLSKVTTWNELLLIFINQYHSLNSAQSDKMAQGIEVKLSDDPDSFIQAINAVLFPSTEAANKSKMTMYCFDQGRVKFIDRGQTFDDVIENAYHDTIEEMKKVGMDILQPIRCHEKIASIETMLGDQKNIILKFGSELKYAVEVIMENMNIYKKDIFPK